MHVFTVTRYSSSTPNTLPRPRIRHRTTQPSSRLRIPLPSWPVRVASVPPNPRFESCDTQHSSSLRYTHDAREYVLNVRAVPHLRSTRPPEFDSSKRHGFGRTPKEAGARSLSVHVVPPRPHPLVAFESLSLGGWPCPWSVLGPWSTECFRARLMALRCISVSHLLASRGRGCRIVQIWGRLPSEQLYAVRSKIQIRSPQIDLSVPTARESSSSSRPEPFKASFLGSSPLRM